MSIKAFAQVNLILATFLMIGCIEVRDPEQTPKVEPPVQQLEAALPELVIDQPMYIFEGKLLTEKQITFIEIDEGRKLSEEPTTVELKLSKLIFTENGSLQIFNNDLVLNVEEIQSYNGKIFTYPEGTKASANTSGRNGGRINLLAKFASGRLLLEFRGEEGGNGSSPAPDPAPVFNQEICSYIRGKRGADGKPGGRSGYIEASVKNESNPFEIRIQTLSVSGGTPEKGIPGRINHQIIGGLCNPFFSQFATDGQDGSIGAPGEKENSEVRGQD